MSGSILIYNSFFHTILKKNGDEIVKHKRIETTTKNTSKNTYDKTEKSVDFFNLFVTKENKIKDGIYKIIEYPLIILFIITGALFLMCSGDLISIFISIELQSYGLYILSTLHRDSEQSTWGGLTYFLLGGLSSCFILLGSALLYINSGTTSLDGIYIISTITEIIPNNISTITNLNIDSVVSIFDYYYLNIALIILSVGFLFKVSAAPFHFWSPDVYDAIPTTVTTYVAIIAKISIFIFLLELVYYMNLDIFTFSWKNCILVSSLFSLIIGSVLGLTQSRIKKVYAYSTINHVGFILLALCINSTESIQAYIFYILSYSISNLNAFIILVTIGYTLIIYINNKSENKAEQLQLKDIENSPIQLVSQLKGYFYINSFLALSLAITLFSFMGIPPLLGFFAKQMVLSAALDKGYIFITLIGILTSVIGGVYYLNIVKTMFFFESEYTINPSLKKGQFLGLSFTNKNITLLNYKNVKINSALSCMISLLTLLLLLFIFIPNESFNLAKILSLFLFN